MTYDEIVKILNSRKKGTFLKVQWSSNVPVYKKFSQIYFVQKVTCSTIVWGVNYNNKKNVQLNRAIGNLPLTPQPLPWGHWIDGFENIFIEHKDKIYLRMYPANIKNKMSSVFLLNGKPIPIEELKNLNIVTNSYWTKQTSDTLCFTKNIADIQKIYN